MATAPPTDSRFGVPPRKRRALCEIARAGKLGGVTASMPPTAPLDNTE